MKTISTHWGRNKMAAISQTTLSYACILIQFLLNVLAQIKRQAVFWTNDGCVYWHMFGSFGSEFVQEVFNLFLLSLILLQKSYRCFIICLDFSKAPDTVDHDIMLQKLSHYGILGSALNWLSSYLSDQKQFVTYNDVFSYTKVITCGVPQSSILDLLSFLFRLNDLFNICKLTTPILFAVDTSLFPRGSDLDIMKCIINEEFTLSRNLR